MTRRSIPPQDHLWLELDRPTNLLVITSVMWTSKPVNAKRLRSVLAERLVERYPVFRQRPVPGALPGQAWWEDDPVFDIDRHIVVERMPGNRDQAALQDYVAQLRSTPFDHQHPLWAVHLLTGYGHGSALVQRYHHSMADGIRLMQVGLGLLDPADGTDRAPAAVVGRSGPAPSVVHPAAAADRVARAVGGGPLLDAAAAVTGLIPESVRPGHLLDVTAGTALTLLHTAGSVVKIAGWTNPHTDLDGEVGVAKTAVWGDPVPLDRLRELATATGTTVGDICTALVAGAVGRYLEERAEEHPDGESPALPDDLAWMVPVNLAPFDAALPPDLGNHFALVLAVLPHRAMPLRERVAEVHARMARIQESYEPAITFGISQGIALAPAPVGKWLSDSLAGKTVGVVTNVPGPRSPMTLAGAPVTGMVGWAPCSANQAITVCIVSYAGVVTFGFGTDRTIVGDPDRLVAALDAELAAATDAIAVPTTDRAAADAPTAAPATPATTAARS